MYDFTLNYNFFVFNFASQRLSGLRIIQVYCFIKTLPKNKDRIPTILSRMPYPDGY